MSDSFDFPLWAVYDHPKDYPNNYVARQFRGLTPTNNIIIGDLEIIRQMLLVDMGLTCLPRQEEDDPCIVETWV